MKKLNMSDFCQTILTTPIDKWDEGTDKITFLTLFYHAIGLFTVSPYANKVNSAILLVQGHLQFGFYNIVIIFRKLKIHRKL